MSHTFRSSMEDCADLNALCNSVFSDAMSYISIQAEKESATISKINT